MSDVLLYFFYLFLFFQFGNNYNIGPNTAVNGINIFYFYAYCKWAVQCNTDKLPMDHFQAAD